METLIAQLSVGLIIGAILGSIVLLAKGIVGFYKNKDKTIKYLLSTKKYFGEFMIIIGVYFFIHNIFDFSHYSRGGGLLNSVKEVSYYYTQSSIYNIAWSVVVIILGILIIKSKKQKYETK